MSTSVLVVLRIVSSPAEQPVETLTEEPAAVAAPPAKKGKTTLYKCAPRATLLAAAALKTSAEHTSNDCACLSATFLNQLLHHPPWKPSSTVSKAPSSSRTSHRRTGPMSLLRLSTCPHQYLNPAHDEEATAYSCGESPASPTEHLWKTPHRGLLWLLRLPIRAKQLRLKLYARQPRPLL